MLILKGLKKPYTEKNKLVFFIALFILNIIITISGILYIYHNDTYTVNILEIDSFNANTFNNINKSFKLKPSENAIKVNPFDFFKDFHENPALKNHKDFFPDKLLLSAYYTNGERNIYYDKSKDSIFISDENDDIIYYSIKTDNKDYLNALNAFIFYRSENPDEPEDVKNYIKNKELNNYIFILQKNPTKNNKKNYFELTFFNEPLHQSLSKSIKMSLMYKLSIVDGDEFDSFLTEIKNNKAENKQIRYYKTSDREIYKTYTNSEYLSDTDIISSDEVFKLKPYFNFNILFKYILYSYTLFILIIISYIISIIRNKQQGS